MSALLSEAERQLLLWIKSMADVLSAIDFALPQSSLEIMMDGAGSDAGAASRGGAGTASLAWTPLAKDRQQESPNEDQQTTRSSSSSTALPPQIVQAHTTVQQGERNIGPSSADSSAPSSILRVGGLTIMRRQKREEPLGIKQEEEDDDSVAGRSSSVAASSTLRAVDSSRLDDQRHRSSSGSVGAVMDHKPPLSRMEGSLSKNNDNNKRPRSPLSCLDAASESVYGNHSEGRVNDGEGVFSTPPHASATSRRRTESDGGDLTLGDTVVSNMNHHHHNDNDPDNKGNNKGVHGDSSSSTHRSSPEQAWASYHGGGGVVPETLLQRLESENASEQERLKPYIREVQQRMRQLKQVLVSLGGGANAAGQIIDVPVAVLDRDVELLSTENSRLGELLLQRYAEAEALAQRVEQRILCA